MRHSRSAAVVFISAALLATSCGSAANLESQRDASDAGGGRADASTVIAVDASAISDASTFDAAAPSVDELFAPCTTSRDVFEFDVEGPQAALDEGKHTYTNLGSNFTARGPLEYQVDQGLGGGAGSVQIATSSPAIPSLGTYAQPANPSGPGPFFEFVDIDQGCTVKGGSFTLIDLQLGDGGAPTSFSVAFDLLCDAYGPTDTARGCLHYEAP